jgi:hypothetical protein
MAFGDGIRRKIPAISPTERTLRRDAFVALRDNPAFQDSFWDKQNG